LYPTKLHKLKRVKKIKSWTSTCSKKNMDSP
jgi:hypothetical protein